MCCRWRQECSTATTAIHNLVGRRAKLQKQSTTIEKLSTNGLAASHLCHEVSERVRSYYVTMCDVRYYRLSNARYCQTTECMKRPTPTIFLCKTFRVATYSCCAPPEQRLKHRQNRVAWVAFIGVLCVMCQVNMLKIYSLQVIDRYFFKFWTHHSPCSVSLT